MSTQTRRLIPCSTATATVPWQDPTTFKAFYEKEVGLIYFTVKAYRLCDADQDEIVQETFLRLYAAREGVDPAKARAFLVVTARNLSLDLLRRRNTRRTDLAGEDIAACEASLWNSDNEHDARVAACGQVVEKIGKTPGGEVFAMFYGEGLSIKEICERTSEAVGTVTARLWRVRQKHRAKIRSEVEACAAY